MGLNNLREIIDFFNTDSYVFLIFVSFIVLTLLAKIAILIALNISLIKLGKNIEYNIEENDFCKKLIKEYQEMLKVQYDSVNTSFFLDAYFLSKKKKLIFYLDLLEHSAYFYILLGLLVSFITVFSSIIHLELENISGLEEFLLGIEDLIYVLRPAAFYFILGIIAAIVISLFKKLFNLRGRLDNVKLKLKNHLENKIKYKYNYHLKQLKLFENLIDTINDSFIRLEDLIEDTVLDVLTKDDCKTTYQETQQEVISEIATSKEEND